MSMIDSDIIVRINGVLPEISEIGSPDFSKRAAEILRKDVKVNTSCSLFARKNQAQNSDSYFHLLVDVGTGVVESLTRGYSQIYKNYIKYNNYNYDRGNNTEQPRKSGSPIGSLSSMSSQLVTTANSLLRIQMYYFSLTLTTITSESCLSCLNILIHRGH
jgi:hypothetical protein